MTYQRVFYTAATIWAITQSPMNADQVNADGCENTICQTLPTNLDKSLLGNLGYVQSVTSDAQAGFDRFAWRMFVALNWPADGGSIKNDRPQSTDYAPRRWENFITREALVNAMRGSDEQMVDGGCATSGTKLLQLDHSQNLTPSGFVQAKSEAPLIDVNGNFVVFDARMNDVIKNKSIDFFKNTTPEGAPNNAENWDFGAGKQGIEGPIDIKTAWRIVTEDENTDDYFTRQAQIKVDVSGGKTKCIDAKVALVGMHIAQKTQYPVDTSKAWVWATFEHKRNAPLNGSADGSKLPVSIHYTSAQTRKDPNSGQRFLDQACELPSAGAIDVDYAFFNPDCKTSDGKACEPNQHIPIGKDGIVWENEPPYAKSYMTTGPNGERYGTQVVRCIKTYNSAHDMNTEFQRALAGSVWENYELVGSQWALPASPEGFHGQGYQAAPLFSANMTMETFTQLDDVYIWSEDDPTKSMSNAHGGSCIACHSLAGYHLDENKKPVWGCATPTPNRFETGHCITTDFVFFPEELINAKKPVKRVQ